MLPPPSTDHSYVFPHRSQSHDLQYSVNCSPGPSLVSAHIPRGNPDTETRPRTHPMVKIFCGTKMRHVTHIPRSGELGQRRQRHGRDGNKTLSFRGKSGAWEEGGQFRRQSVSVIKKLNKYYEAREKYLNHRWTLRPAIID